MKNRTRSYLKIASLFFIFTFIFNILSLGISADETFPDTSHAKGVYLYNFESDQIIINKSDDKLLFPSSMTKIVTALIAIDTLDARLTEKVTITDEMLSEAYGAGMKLKGGMTVTVSDLLYGLICGGGNDAALVLANLCSENVDNFVEKMNSYALDLGAKNTFFTNPTGLDDENMHTSLSDIALFCKEAAKNTLYMEISNTKSFVYTPEGSSEEIKIFNRNSLISTYYSQNYQNGAANGLMAGNTDIGGYCVATIAEFNGLNFLCIIMGASSDEENIYSYKIANDLLKYSKNYLRYEKIASMGDKICEIPLKYSTATDNNETSFANCVLEKDLYVLKNTSKDNYIEIKHYFFDDPLEAPASKGDAVGGADFFVDGKLVATIPLILSDNVEANSFLVLMEKMKSFFFSRFFIISLLSFIVLFSVYFYSVELKFRRKKVKNLKYKNFY